MTLETRKYGHRFPQKLWEAATYNEDGTIYWSASGHSIIFRFDFMKKYCLPDGNPLFHTKRLSSFVRLLNSYGFRKDKKSETDLHGKPSAALYLQYSREFFQKGRPDLLHLIERKPRNPIIDKCKLKTRKQKSKFEFREKVVKNKLESVDTARKNFTKVIAETFKAHKNGNKENILKKSMTVEGIKNLCETTEDTIVHVASKVVVLKGHKTDSNTWQLVEVRNKKKDKFSKLVGDWNATPITAYNLGPFCVDKEEVVEYQENV